MIKKQGITVTVLVITIIVLTILAGTITISTLSTINYSQLSAWVNEIAYIQDVVNEEKNASSNMDYIMQDIELDISSKAQQEQFEGETISDSNTLSLKVLDLGKLKITNTSYGNLDTSADVYAVSEQTGKVYYVQGVEIEGEIYYSLTDALSKRFSLPSSVEKLSTVVFIPSVVGYSNNPITVSVKMPNTYTNISITTSNNDIQIGSQTVKETTYEYGVNTNRVEGNYTITVAYNDGNRSLRSNYEVNGYDNIEPEIVPLDYYNIVYKENGTETIDYITNVTATDASGIKIMKYALGSIAQNNAQTYFKDNGNIIANGRINLDRNTTVYTIYAEDNAGNFAILTFDKKDIMPEKWKENISYIQDRVPIPKGFVASQATGENIKNGGLVIYEGTTPVTDANVDVARNERNQYVWVPIARENFITKFIRQNFGLNYNISNTLGTGYWEVVLNTSTNMPLTTQNSNYVTNTTQTGGITNTLAEVQAMYASVKEYEGFYIARYEAGVDTKRTSDNGVLETKVYSMMGKIPYTYISWGESLANDTNGAVQVARSIYPVTDTSGKYGVVSTLTYGVQWDSTLQWWLDTKAVTTVTNSVSYGNYSDHVINVGDLNEGAKYAIYTTTLGEYQQATSASTKDAGTSWALSTGALKSAKVNNIYDMAGNMWEWTMGGLNTDTYSNRGGYFYCNGVSNDRPVAYRGYANPSEEVRVASGFRASLYIKLPT